MRKLWVLGEVLAVRPLLLEQIRHGVEAEAVDPQVQPEPQGVDDGVTHGRVVVVQVGLMAEETVPEVLPAYRIESPVRRLGVHEDDPSVGITGVVVRPDVEVAVGPVGVFSRRLEPRVLVTGVVHDEVDDHPHPAVVRQPNEPTEVLQRAELRQDAFVVRDVVSAVAQR